MLYPIRYHVCLFMSSAEFILILHLSLTCEKQKKCFEIPVFGINIPVADQFTFWLSFIVESSEEVILYYYLKPLCNF